MTIEELKSGSYRIKQMVNGTTYRVTIDHKPSKKEALQLIANEMSVKGKVTSKMPLKRCCEAYIESKSDILSPSSIRGYTSLIKQISERLASTPVNLITRPMVQTEINNYTNGHSRKTILNLSSFICSVLSFYGNEVGKILIIPEDKLDETKDSYEDDEDEPYTPTTEEVQAILNELKGTKYEVALLLACAGLRRSEVCALTIDDLSDDNILTINKALVQDKNKKWIKKRTKTPASRRKLEISDYLANRIREQGYVYDGFPGQIYKRLTDTQKKLGIQHFSLHTMRRFFCSSMHNIGCTDKQSEGLGGWANPVVMKKKYQKSMEMDKANKKLVSYLDNLVGQ